MITIRDISVPLRHDPSMLYYLAAQALGISRPTFCRRLQKARAMLRRELEGRETDEGYAHSEKP